MKNELVSFKGMGDGVRINVDEHAQVYEVIAELERKLIESKAFFGDGNCKIRFGSRRFTPGEKQRFETLTKGLLPLARISFDEPEKAGNASNDWLVQYKEKHGVHPAEEVITHETEERKPPAAEEEFFSVFRSNRARLYQGIVHDGMTIRSDGHLILLGTAEAGAELIAVGNILVIGGLYGTAHAGCNGHNGSYVLAMDMKPELIKIASAAAEYTYEPPEENEEPEPEKKGLFGKRKKKSEEPVPEPEENEYPAVALFKNNKIELDNFTIKIFTNPKNMV